jgi:Uma2 family endonuclease
MTTSPADARCSRLLGRFVTVLTEEFQLPVASYGDMTCRREQSQRGFEPDECFYITNVEKVLGKAVLDFDVDPPPDLGLEVDITRSSLNRLEIYARIRVPEVWSYDEKQLVVYHLNQHGAYEPATESHYFPGIPLAELSDWLARRNDVDENTLVREFRAWVRGQRRS